MQPACFSQGKLEEAAHYFAEASRVNPEDYQSPTFLAKTYTGLGRKGESEAARRRALQITEKHVALHPDDPRALYLGATSLALLAQGERALEWTRRALAIDPDDPGVLYNVACSYALLGESEEALNCLEKAGARQMAQGLG